MRVVLSLVMLGLLFAGCSTNVRGVYLGSTETFSGTATAQKDGKGTLEITNNKGVTCKGNFTYVTKKKGRGSFNCGDGRSGPFSFSATDSPGVGYGSFGGRSFTFIFE